MDLVVRPVIMRAALAFCTEQWRAPFGFLQPLRVFVDPDLLQYDEVWAAAGTWNDNFGANPNDIARVACGEVADLKRG
jgi:prolyl-tRNA editing enzyme YbaK/EbsC (Cys-tRNA(Pro) deacylase)